jgi:hypothetical protein
MLKPWLIPIIAASCLLASSLGAATATQDVVQLSNGQRITGTLNLSAPVEPELVEIKTPQGVLRLRKDLIASIDEGFDSRRARTRDDDPVALYDLAKWCMSHEMKDKALEMIEIADRCPNRDLDVLALKARLIDLLKSPTEAEAMYVAYRDAGGTNGETLARLAELEQARTAYEGGAKPQIDQQQRVPVIADGLEVRGWEMEAQQWSNPVDSKIITEDREDGSKNQVLQIEFRSGDKEKGSVKKTYRQSIEATPMLTLWAQNKSDRPVRLALAVKTGKYVFHESPSLDVPSDKKWVQMRFNLSGKNFKSETSGWGYTGTVSDLNDVKELQFLIYNGSNSGILVLDEVQFLSAKDL